MKAATSGKESLQPDSKWNIITWTLMTAATLAFGMANRQMNSSVSSPSSSSKSSDEPESKSEPLRTEVSPASEDVEVQQLSQLGEKMNLLPNRPVSTDTDVLTVSELADMADEEILQAMDAGRIAQHELEDRLEDNSRAVQIRRKFLASGITHAFDVNAIPYENYDYDQVKGKCCENVIGYANVFNALSETVV